MDEIQVSVLCTVYNHEKYLRQCLEGFVSQKTNFAYEVVINDDASMDSSAEIIKEFVEKYPDIIVPLFQRKNLYKQGIKISEEVLLPKARGRYIAYCEGDDYWCDDLKLQRQYDFMEKNPDCVMCVHNTIIHDLSGKKKDRLFNSWQDVHIMTDVEVFFGWNVHTSSYFVRREFAKNKMECWYWSGDYKHLTWAYHNGNIVCLPFVMSVYNWGNPTGATMTNVHSKRDYLVKRIEARKTYLEEFNILTDYKHDAIIQERMLEIEFDSQRTQIMPVLFSNAPKEQLISAAKSVSFHPYYSYFLKEKGQIKGILYRYAFSGYRCFPIWRLYIFILGRFVGGWL